MRFRLHCHGAQRLEVRAICLSYLGADVVESLAFQVLSQPQRNQGSSGDNVNDDEPEEDDDELPDDIDFADSD